MTIDTTSKNTGQKNAAAPSRRSLVALAAGLVALSASVGVAIGLRPTVAEDAPRVSECIERSTSAPEAFVGRATPVRTAGNPGDAETNLFAGFFGEAMDADVVPSAVAIPDPDQSGRCSRAGGGTGPIHRPN